MRGPRAAIAVVIAGACIALSGCRPADATCAAGLKAEFDLTVAATADPEPSVQYCALGHCSPRPTPGPIPRVQQDTADDHAAQVVHVGRDRWRIAPRSIGGTPATATIHLYRHGTPTATRIVHLDWPRQDPCAASNPPDPHPTITG